MKPVAALVAVLALAAAPSAQTSPAADTPIRRCGTYPPFRPDLHQIRADNMPCWSAKLLLDEAITQQITSRRLLEIVGFVCTYRRSGRSTGRVVCASGAQIARANFKASLEVG